VPKPSESKITEKAPGQDQTDRSGEGDTKARQSLSTEMAARRSLDDESRDRLEAARDDVEGIPASIIVLHNNMDFFWEYRCLPLDRGIHVFGRIDPSRSAAVNSYG
jgi:hypothetical protein